MAEFTTKVTPLKYFDPFKRVGYPPGMLLTPTEFLQEQYYFLERNHLHHRLLHGYGTVCGMKVSVQDNDMVSVSEGVAIDIWGRLIRIETPQCVSLKEWLKEYQQKSHISSPPDLPPASLYVVLCYKECLSDKVLIRTSPCQTEKQSEAYSRVQEYFHLKLTTELPHQDEEDIIRAFGDLISEFQVSSASARLSDVELQEAKSKIRSRVLSLYPDESPPLLSSPPDDWMQALHPEDAETLLRLAFRVWVTELKPKLLPNGSCSKSMDDETCILLSELSFNVNPQDWKIEGDVTVNEEDRPFYISTRLLLEYMLNRSHEDLLSGEIAHNSLSGLDNSDDHPQYHNDNRGDALYSRINHTHALENLSDVNVQNLVDNQVLTWDSGNTQWVAQTPSTGVTDHSALSGKLNDDHTQYLMVDGTKALGNDLSAANNKITNLAVATVKGDAVRFEQAVKNNDLAGGDLTGSYPNPSVKNLQGRFVKEVNPDDGQVLSWNENEAEWEPQTIDDKFVQATRGGYAIVAAGYFNTDGTPVKVNCIYNGLEVKPEKIDGNQTGNYWLRFNGYRKPRRSYIYIVKGTLNTKNPSTFQFKEFGSAAKGIKVQIINTEGQFVRGRFMVEISAFGSI